MPESDRRTLAQRERRALVDTMRAVGPDAPTLCSGWTTRDLAAHLVVREGRPDAAPGVFVPALAGRLEALRVREAEREWEELLGTISEGAPWYSPLRYADTIANAGEYLVHHEDVRRAGGDWTEREFPLVDLERIWLTATTLARPILHKVSARVELRTPPGLRLDKGSAVTTGAKLAPVVTISAAPVELLLWVFGRNEVHIDISGEEGAIKAVTQVPRGL